MIRCPNPSGRVAAALCAIGPRAETEQGDKFRATWVRTRTATEINVRAGRR
jgi:hypothetical protein